MNAVANRRRRDLLDCLREHGGRMDLSDAASVIAARRYGSSTTEADVERVYVSLRGVHVPRLADRGVVEFSRDRNVVSLPEDDD